MNKILLIITREYLTRVKKKSFVVMTILGPILMASLIVVPIYIAQLSDDTKTIAVVDESGLFYKRFDDSENLKFVYLNSKIAEAKKEFIKTDNYAILYIPIDSSNAIVPTSFYLFSNKQPSIIIKSFLENMLKEDIESLKLSKSGIDEKVLTSINTEVDITTIKLKSEGSEEKSYSELSSVLGLFSGFLIYFFIFLYGAQVMRGVIEEKTNRIVEVIISSIKPFELMMGKIIGIALVGLTQFLLWIIFTLSIVTIVQQSFPESFQKNPETYVNTDNRLQMATEVQTGQAGNEVLKEISTELQSIDYPVVILSFIFFFLFGYFLYAALFAAIGSAVDNESDTQQFMLPVTIPLLFSVVLIQFIINNPEGPVAFWLSMIPLTSPVIMMVRIAFGVPYWEILLSALILIITFFGATIMAGKIYRIGILMYGKKIGYRDLLRWLKY